MRATRLLGGGLFGAMIAAAMLAGCRPRTSQESIYRDAERDPDPAFTAPYLDPGPPATAETSVARAIAENPLPPPQPPPPERPAYQSADPPDPDPLIRVWVEGRQPAAALDRKTMVLSDPVTLRPTVRFEMDPRMGTFRSAVIEVYPVVDGRTDRTAGVRLNEALDPDRPIEQSSLAPGKEIDLVRPGKDVTIRRVVGGQPADPFALAADSGYEIQVIVGGNRWAGVMAVRVYTAPPPTSQPAEPSAPPEGPSLPPGVIVPGGTP